MRRKLFISSILVLLAINAMNIFSQDPNSPRWNFPPASTRMVAGEYPPLPEHYEHPNVQTNVVKSNDGNITFLVPPNFRPLPQANIAQSEVTFVTQQGNQNVMYGGWNSIQGPSTFYATGWARTTDGGTTWTGSHTTVPNYGDPGPWIWPTTGSFANRLGMSYITTTGSMGATWSSDAGTTWQTNVTFPGASTSADKNLSAVDDVVGSPFFGRAYTVYTEFGGSYVNRIVGTYTSNGGVTWSNVAPISPSPSSGHHNQGCDVIVGPGGVVYVVWAHCTTNGQNSTEDNLGFAKSTDGGVTWTVSNNNVADVNGIRSSNLLNNCRANGFPRIAVDKSGGSRNGWIYVTLCEKTIAPARDGGDATLLRSTDGGATWSHTLVNSDPAGKLQWHSAVCVDQVTGMVAVGYYDQRNTTSAQGQYYVSFSTNGGSNWTDVQASDHTWTVDYIHFSGVAAGYMGDYSGITWSNGKFYPYWNDPSVNPSASLQQVWTCAINPVVLANDIAVGPFLSLPPSIVQGTAYNIKAKVSNVGSSGQSNVPVRLLVNGTVVTTNTISSLPAGSVDSTTFSWTPSASGSALIKIAGALSTDGDRSNDTVATTVTVLPAGTVIQGTTLCRNGLNILIPSLGSAPRDSIVVNIPNTFGIVDVNVRLDTILHTYDGDLSIVLNHLAGTSTLAGQVGASGTNFINTVLNDSAATPIGSGVAPFTGSFQPSTPLSAFNGLAVNGSWVLAIDDLASGDSGVLKAWCIVLRYQTIVGGIQTIEIPNYFSLAQNYPNPFNPTTSIKFSVPSPEMVTLKVYDVLGKEVAVLVNEMKQPGFHTVDFDASRLASGIYFYRIDAGQFSSVKRMVLVK